LLSSAGTGVVVGGTLGWLVALARSTGEIKGDIQNTEKPMLRGSAV
jgi:hypothetical protein